MIDSLGLPSYFRPYSTPNCVSLCPSGRKTIATNGINYAWSRAQNLVGVGGRTTAFAKMSSIFVVWDNNSYTLPSVFGVPETTGGPSVVTRQLFYFPHNSKKRVNWLYLDGHVENRPGAARGQSPHRRIGHRRAEDQADRVAQRSAHAVG